MNPHEARDFPSSVARWVVAEDVPTMSGWARDFIVAELERHPDLLLCASAGSTPTQTYGLLARERTTRPALFDRLRLLKIDEWGGLSMDNPASCEAYMREHLVRPLGITPDRYQAFHSQPADPRAECLRVSRWLAENGPIDVCVLGLGVNGHLALNEPAAEFEPHAHPSELAPSSLRHPMLEASAERPTLGLTLGLAEILQSRKLLLLASGASKRAPLERLRQPRLTPAFPASFLWLHPAVTVLCDREAGDLAEGIGD